MEHLCLQTTENSDLSNSVVFKVTKTLHKMWAAAEGNIAHEWGHGESGLFSGVAEARTKQTAVTTQNANLLWPKIPWHSDRPQ